MRARSTCRGRASSCTTAPEAASSRTSAPRTSTITSWIATARSQPRRPHASRASEALCEYRTARGSEPAEAALDIASPRIPVRRAQHLGLRHGPALIASRGPHQKPASLQALERLLDLRIVLGDFENQFVQHCIHAILIVFVDEVYSDLSA